MNQMSLESFEKILPKIGERQNQLLTILSDGNARTDAMIGRAVNLPINCITNRRGELVKKGCVAESHKDICIVTGGKSTYWKVTLCGLEVNNFKSNQKFSNDMVGRI